ncbi:restriction endonuclease subunit S [Gallibacterium anatis CCM5995]|uniref:restriction endonuclease subunit S n=1 Tax=Gallibacterium anatis TaxID=750 RepID=UPI0005319232|nr:restriction endonuclease subunit S [Gallibacterium anatis]KGQ26830.1 restriction endonuclease subunit S [Gallibacterium anatis CCM5995]
MNYLEKLLQGAPVEWKTLGEVLDYEQPTPFLVKSKEYSDEHETPVLTAGQSFILGYTNETDGIYQASKENPVIIFDDFTTSFHWVDFPFKVKSSAMKMLSLTGDTIHFKYVFYAMKCIHYKPEDHARQWISKYSKIKIPIPPLSVQQEIVRILDTLTEQTKELTKELNKELALRQKQYQYYQDMLLNFKELSGGGDEVKWKTLGEIGEVRMCKRILKEQTADTGEIPFYKIGTFGKEANAFISRELFNEYKSKYSYPKKGNILISASGTIGRTVIFDGKDAYFQDSNIVWIENNESVVLDKFLFYLYQVIKWNIAEVGTIQRLYNDNLKKIKIPIPHIEEQKRIVEILDKFDTLTNSISEGLPKEIKLRQKQYEYYRDLLLNFKQDEASLSPS